MSSHRSGHQGVIGGGKRIARLTADGEGERANWQPGEGLEPTRSGPQEGSKNVHFFAPGAAIRIARTVIPLYTVRQVSRSPRYHTWRRSCSLTCSTSFFCTKKCPGDAITAPDDQ